MPHRSRRTPRLPTVPPTHRSIFTHYPNRMDCTSSQPDRPRSETDLHSPRRTFETDPPSRPSSPHLPRSSRPCTTRHSTVSAADFPSKKRIDPAPTLPANPTTSAPFHPAPPAPQHTSLPAATAAPPPPGTPPAPIPHTQKESETATVAADAETNPPQTAHKQKRPPALAGSPPKSQSSPRGLWPLSDPHHLNHETHSNLAKPSLALFASGACPERSRRTVKSCSQRTPRILRALCVLRFSPEAKPYRFPATRSACRCCNACTRTSPRCNAAIPSAAARAADSVVIVVIRAVTAARRIAFSSNHGSAPCGVFTIS